MPASKPKIYYSHAVCTYEHPIEARALQKIAREFPGFSIENPLKYDWHPMPWFLRRVDRCELLVFSRLDGQLTGGAGMEIEQALRSGKLVFELPESCSGYLTLITRPPAYLSQQASVQLCRKWAAREGVDW